MAGVLLDVFSGEALITYTAAHHRGAIQKPTALALFALSVLASRRNTVLPDGGQHKRDSCFHVTVRLSHADSSQSRKCHPHAVERSADSLGSLISALKCLISLTGKSNIY